MERKSALIRKGQHMFIFQRRVMMNTFRQIFPQRHSMYCTQLHTKQSARALVSTTLSTVIPLHTCQSEHVCQIFGFKTKRNLWMHHYRFLSKSRRGSVWYTLYLKHKQETSDLFQWWFYCKAGITPLNIMQPVKHDAAFRENIHIIDPFLFLYS